jgi:hypothetical protein
MKDSPKTAKSSAPPQVSDTPETQLRTALALAIKRSPRSRAEIAEIMTALLERPADKPITVHIVNSWTSETKDRVRFPAAWVPAFCAAAGDETVLLAFLFPKHKALLELKEGIEALRREIAALMPKADAVAQELSLRANPIRQRLRGLRQYLQAPEEMK